mmetsp:Transcript_38085/g.105120  ORF Transcript_38085/g.105120 Transcript_38085/m.105120 type:complete len:276 (-) Transcript_38085:601-1428(-)
MPSSSVSRNCASPMPTSQRVSLRRTTFSGSTGSARWLRVIADAARMSGRMRDGRFSSAPPPPPSEPLLPSAAGTSPTAPSALLATRPDPPLALRCGGEEVEETAAREKEEEEERRFAFSSKVPSSHAADPRPCESRETRSRSFALPGAEPSVAKEVREAWRDECADVNERPVDGGAGRGSAARAEVGVLGDASPLGSDLADDVAEKVADEDVEAGGAEAGGCSRVSSTPFSRNCATCCSSESRCRLKLMPTSRKCASLATARSAPRSGKARTASA